MKIYVKAKPAAKNDRVVGWLGEVVKIELKEKPVDGKANKALIDFLTKELGLSKNNVRIVSGLTSKMKLIEVVGVDDIEEVRRKLA